MAGFLGGLFQTILGSLAGGLGGGQSSQPAQASVGVEQSLNPGQVPIAPDPVPPAPPPKGLGASMRASGHSFMADVLDQAGQTARKAMFASYEGKIAGQAQRSYNQTAFPGTTPWEQLGSSAGSGADYASMAQKSEELTQRERESQRGSATQLAAARIGVGERLATTLIGAGGDPRMIADILLKTGAIPPGQPIDVSSMSRDRLASEIGLAQANTRRSQDLLLPDIGVADAKQAEAWASTDKMYADADRSRVETILAPARFALDEWKAKVGSSYTANEVRAVSDIIANALSDLGVPVDVPKSLSESVIKSIIDSGISQGDAYLLKEAIVGQYK